MGDGNIIRNQYHDRVPVQLRALTEDLASEDWFSAEFTKDIIVKRIKKQNPNFNVKIGLSANDVLLQNHLWIENVDDLYGSEDGFLYLNVHCDYNVVQSEFDGEDCVIL